MTRRPPFASHFFALKCATDAELLGCNHRKMMAAGLERDSLLATRAEHRRALELKDLRGSLSMGAMTVTGQGALLISSERVCKWSCIDRQFEAARQAFDARSDANLALLTTARATQKWVRTKMNVVGVQNARMRGLFGNSQPRHSGVNSCSGEVLGADVLK